MRYLALVPMLAILVAGLYIAWPKRIRSRVRVRGPYDYEIEIVRHIWLMGLLGRPGITTVYRGDGIRWMDTTSNRRAWVETDWMLDDILHTHNMALRDERNTGAAA